MNKFVVAIGTLTDVITFLGPFESYAAALDFMEAKFSKQEAYEVITLDAPESV